MSTYTSLSYNGDCYGRSDLDELASRLEALVDRPPESIAENASRKRLLEAMKRAIPELETPAEAAQRVPYSPFEIMGAKIAYDLDLFNILNRSEYPQSTSALAQITGGEEELLTRLLKFLASMSMIDEVGVGLWGPSRLTGIFTVPTIAAGIAHHTDNLGTGILALPGYLRRHNYRSPSNITDTAFTDANPSATHIFEWMGKNTENLRTFMLWMGAHRLRDKEWLDVFPFRDVVCSGFEAGNTPVFVDVGGGIGHQCKAVLARYPELKGRVFLEDEEETLKGALPVPGMETVAMDFFKTQPIRGARVYYLRSILHDWSDSPSRTILSIIRSAMGQESIILIDDHVVAELKAHKTVMQMDMTMLLALGAEERTERRWRQLVESVGLRIDHIYCYDEQGGDSIIVVKRKEGFLSRRGLEPEVVYSLSSTKT